MGVLLTLSLSASCSSMSLSPGPYSPSTIRARSWSRTELPGLLSFGSAAMDASL